MSAKVHPLRPPERLGAIICVDGIVIKLLAQLAILIDNPLIINHIVIDVPNQYSSTQRLRWDAGKMAVNSHIHKMAVLGIV